MKYKLQNIIDIEQFQNLQNKLNEIYSFPSAIIDNDGNILTATAWQDICTQFHRKNKDSEWHCIQSDQYILSHIHEANPAVSYRCPHGLVDNATPIIIDGIHYGNYFTGQFFLEKPNMDFYRTQAKKYGFDEEAYLQAVRKVPIWTQEQLDNYLFFIKGLIAVISESGLKKLKEMEHRKKIKASEERHRSIIQTALDGFWLTDINGQLLEVNDSYCKMSGYREEELLSMGVADLDVIETPTDVHTHMQEVVEKGAVRFETKHQRKDGSVFDVEISVQFRNEEGGRCVCFLRDISERKQAEERLRELEERFRLTFNTSPDAVNINKMDGTYLEINEGFIRMTGFSRKDVIGKTSADINIWDIPADRERLVEGLQKDGYVRNLESRFLMKDGSYKTALMSAAIINLKGEPHILSITRDISGFRKAEEDKLILERQLQQAQKMESVGRLAGGVAHDFNNMLGVILGHAELAMENLDPSQPIFADLQQIKQAADRSTDITRQLLTFARKQIVSPKIVDLNETIAGMLKMLLRLIGEDIDLAWLPGKGLWPIKIDPSQIDQILANLCVNARDAIAGVGKITVGSGNCTLDEEYCSAHAGFVPGEYVKIEVSDDGSGMDKETLPHIFEPFFTTKGVNEGTGLGLATVYGIVKQNDGFVNVYSEPGQETTFTIYLPRHVGTISQKQLELTAEPALCGNETVLLVEDEPTILNITTTMLQRLGYKVLMAGTPGEAIYLADDHPGEIHLLLTDVIMPEMNGRMLTEKLIINRPGLKCLFMSGYTANVISHHGVLDDGVHFIQKPFAKRDLAAKIRIALDD